MADTATLPVLHGSAAESFAYYGDRAGWCIALSVHRDSDALDRSNWRTIAPDMLRDHPADAAIERMNHWAVGWVEYLLVRPGTAAETAALDWRRRLDNYPAADDEDYSALEYAEEWCVRCDRGTREDHPRADRHGRPCRFRSADDAAELRDRWTYRRD